MFSKPIQVNSPNAATNSKTANILVHIMCRFIGSAATREAIDSTC